MYTKQNLVSLILAVSLLLAVAGIANAEPPVADAGDAQTVEADGPAGASVTLDGSGSYDPDGDPLTYSWTWSGGSGTGVNPIITLPLGTTAVTLTVNDGQSTDSDFVVIEVVDTTPPTIICPDDVTVVLESGGTVVPLQATATDIYDPDPVITSDELATYPLGETVVTFTATDDSGNTSSCITTVTVSLPVAIDIKPMSCPNPLKVNSRGVVPVAIIGTENLDVTEVDPASVRLEGVAPLRWSIEDVSTPFEPFLGKESEFDCTEEGPDGYLDLTLMFDIQEILEALGEVNDGDVLALQLVGNLKEALDGAQIMGEDVVIILKKGH